MRKQTQNFLDRLNGVKPVNGGSKFKALCPVHGDEHPSLEISEGDDGILIKCWSAGCDYQDICKAINVHPNDLFWDEGNSYSANGYGRNGSTAVLSRNGHAAARVKEERSREDLPPRQPGDLTLIAEHPYYTETGARAFLVRRFHAPDEKRKKGYRKEIPAYRPGEGEEWIKGLAPDTPNVLYHLPEIIASPYERVVWVEGENKADTLHALNILSTTAKGGTGAKNSLPGLERLKGREVAILADEDDAGRLYAEAVKDQLTIAGAKAYICEPLPGDGERPSGYDVVDWLADGGTYQELVTHLLPPPPPPLRYPVLTVAQLLKQPPPKYQVDRFIHEQCLFLLFGPPWSGKSFVGMDLLFSINRGGSWCGRQINVSGPVVYVNADGGRGFRDRVDAFCQANGARPEELGFYTVNSAVPLGQIREVNEFRRTLDSLPAPPVAILFDTYSRCNAGADENNQGEASRVIGNIDYLRAEYGCSVGITHHTSAAGVDPRGSTVLMGAVDASWRIMNSGRNDITASCLKLRDGPRKVEGIEFSLKALPSSNQVVLWHKGTADALTEKMKCEIEVGAWIEEHALCTATEIQEALGFTQQRISDAIRSLGQQNLIVIGPRREGSAAKTFMSKAYANGERYGE